MQKRFFASLATAGLLMSTTAALAATTTGTSTSTRTSAQAAVEDETATALANAVAERRFIRTFMRVGALNSTVYDNETVGTSSFDFTEYVNHPCYHISGATEREECRRQFGLLADLEKMMRDGTLARLLATHELAFDATELRRLMAAVQTAVLGEQAAGSDKDENGTTARSRSALSTREARVWADCEDAANSSVAIQRACYQEATRHMRRN